MYFSYYRYITISLDQSSAGSAYAPGFAFWVPACLIPYPFSYCGLDNCYTDFAFRFRGARLVAFLPCTFVV